jgi:hypothetical protein
LQYGYTWTDQVLDPTIILKDKTSLNKRQRAVARSLGIHVKGRAVMYHDPDDRELIKVGITHRMGREALVTDRREMDRFRGYTRRTIRKWFEPLSRTDIPPFWKWLAGTSYPEHRKRELYEIWVNYHHAMLMVEVRGGDKRAFAKKAFRHVKAFLKRESYLDITKKPRGIYSRGDLYKVLFGPVCSAMEETVYALGQDGSVPFRFIKHVPVADRPDYIQDLWDNSGSVSQSVETDHTAFEAHMTPDVMRTVEFEAYKYLLRDTDYFEELIGGVLDGKNKIHYKLVDMICEGRRMSGEMNTSLGNGLENLLGYLYGCWRNKKVVLCGVVEGDDGLFGMAGKEPLTKTFEPIGFEIKSDTFDNWWDASFCGMNMVVGGIGYSSVVVRDPLKILMKTGWTHSRFMFSKAGKLMQLLRAKAYSLAYESGGCPIAAAMGRYLFRCTRGVTPDFEEVNGYTVGLAALVSLSEERALEMLNRPVPPKARAVVRRKYHMSVAAQEEIERYLDLREVVAPLDHPLILQYVDDRFPESVDVAYMNMGWEGYRVA